MKEAIWAEIVHDILLLKTFTLDHLEALICNNKAKCGEVLLELKQGGLVELKDGVYHLTSDVDKRLSLLAKVREIERWMGQTKVLKEEAMDLCSVLSREKHREEMTSGYFVGDEERIARLDRLWRKACDRWRRRAEHASS